MKNTNEISTYNLPATLQKSYYGKAVVWEPDAESKILRSYDTFVCGIKGGKFVRLWNGYSKTTMNHINDFRNLFGMNPISKKEWENIPCANGHDERYKVEFSNGFVNWIAKVVFDNEDDADSFGESVCESRNWMIGYTVICDF